MFVSLPEAQQFHHIWPDNGNTIPCHQLVSCVAESKVSVTEQVLEKVLHCQSRETDPVFEHVNVRFAVKCTVLLQCLEERATSRSIAIPDKDVFECLYLLFLPGSQTG